MVGICVDTRPYWELPENERTWAKKVRGGTRTQPGVNFWVWNFQHPGRGCYAGVHSTPGAVKHSEKRREEEQWGFILVRPILYSRNTAGSRFYLAPPGAVAQNLFCAHTLKKKGRKIFQWTELHQFMVYNFFKIIFCFTEFLTGSNNKTIAANYFKTSIYIFEFEITSLANFLF